MNADLADYRFGRFLLRPAERQLLIDGEPAPLGARAYDLLAVLVERRDRVVSKDELLDLVWPKAVLRENNLQVHVSALRKVLDRRRSQPCPDVDIDSGRCATDEDASFVLCLGPPSHSSVTSAT